MGLISKEDLHQIINAFCFVMSDKQFQVKHLISLLLKFNKQRNNHQNTFKIIWFIKGPFYSLWNFPRRKSTKTNIAT